VFPLILLALLLPAAGLTAPGPVPWSKKYPTRGDVTIPAGARVLLDTNLNVDELMIMGAVTCADRNLKVAARAIIVHGSFECGTPARRYTKKLTITLVGTDTNGDVHGMGTKVLGVMGGGKLSLHGAKVTTWLRLKKTARKGTDVIQVAAAPGWKRGDRIVVTSTDFHPDHAEEFTVRSVSGTTVRLNRRLAFEHWCQPERFGTWTLHECAEVGLLNRNIVVQGDPSSARNGFGGHIMVMRGGSGRLDGVELTRMGQRGILARYPFHWHMVGNARGQYVRNSSIHHAYNRFITVHGTHHVKLIGNVGYDTFGHGFYLEDGIESKNLIERNLGLMVRRAEDEKPTPSDRSPAVFWISNPDNWIRGNVAAGSEDTGFWMGFPEHPLGPSKTDSVWPRRTPLLQFENNTSHSTNGHGLMVDNAEDDSRHTRVTWYEPRKNPANRESPLVVPHFKNFTVYKSRYEAIWMRSSANTIVSGARIADSYLGAFFAHLPADRHDGTGFIEDSLVVGESSNRGNPDDWEAKGPDGRELPHPWAEGDPIRGLQFYDGPMGLRRVTFANFEPREQRRAGAIGTLLDNPFNVSSHNVAEGIRFINSNRVWEKSPSDKHSGEAFTTFIDLDGSISGLKGARVVANNPVLLTPSCEYRAAWNAHVCPSSNEYVNLGLYTESGENLNETVISRSNGASIKMWGAEDYSRSIHVNILGNTPHSLAFPGGAPKQFHVIMYENPGRVIRLSFAYPSQGLQVLHWGQPIEKASSLASLESGGHKYYYDNAAGRLYLRVAAGDGYDAIEVRRN